jgi:hypothetical protein
MEIKMNAAELLSEAKRLEKKILDKGYIAPSVNFKINWLSDDLSACLSYQVNGDYETQKNIYPHASLEDGWEPIIKQMDDHIDALISVKEARKKEFISAMGRLIDKGREIDIDVEYLNPLTEMMGKLSTNIITKE